MTVVASDVWTVPPMSDPFRSVDGIRWNSALYADPPAEMFTLAQRLLELGGDEVVWQTTDLYLVEQMLSRLETWDGAAASLLRGAPNQCHLNSAAYFAEFNPHGWRIGTGWALSDDGLWRPHSWCVDPFDVAVESTEGRGMYAGLRLNDEEAAIFVLTEDPFVSQRMVSSDPGKWLPLLSVLSSRTPDDLVVAESAWDLLRTKSAS